MNTDIPYLSLVYSQLSAFAGSDSFWQTFNTVYGTQYNFAIADSIRTQWAKGDFSGLPTIEVVSAEVLGAALGGYAASNNTIYLSEALLASGSSEQIVAVIIEEIGHHVDAQINEQDSSGDEGQIFAATVLGQDLDAPTLNLIQKEDDSAVLSVDNILVLIEQSTSGTRSHSTPFTLQNLGFQFTTADYLNKFLGTNISNSYEYNSGNQFKFIQRFPGMNVPISGSLGPVRGKAGIYLDPGYIGAGIEMKAGYNLGELKFSLPVTALVNTTVSSNQLNFNINANLNNPNFSYVLPYAYANLAAVFDYDVKLGAYAQGTVDVTKAVTKIVQEPVQKTREVTNTISL
ncbi:MAG: hypothetical protein VKL42_04070 [Snowella sp.]|nr:hypothetical protein [Snowella sp.]